MKNFTILLKTILATLLLCVLVISSGVMSVSAKEIKKNPRDVKALREIVKKQRALGAKVSNNMDNKKYKWNENGRLVEIKWWGKHLRGTLDLTGLKKLEKMYGFIRTLKLVRVLKYMGLV